jgi:phage terminase small subunit
MKDLTSKQKAFCKEYIKDFNSTQAAIRVGYTVKNADVVGPRLLGKVGVQCEIKRLVDKLNERFDVEIDQIVAKLTSIGFSNIVDILKHIPGKRITVEDLKKLPSDVAYSIDTIQETKDGFKIKMINKIPALELLCRYKGMFIDKHHVEQTGQIKTVVDLVKNANKRRRERESIVKNED